VKTTPTIVAALAVGALVLAACGSGSSGSGSGSGSSGDPLVVGTSLPLTGPLGSIGGTLKPGYEQLVADVNAAGGVDIGGTKRKVTLVLKDNKSDPNLASQQIREIVLKDKASVLLGGATPPINVPEALAAEQARIPIVMTATPNEAFAGGNKAGWTYAWNFFFDEAQFAGQAVKAVALTPTNKKIALFTDTEPDGTVERGLFKQAAKDAGFTVVGDYSFPVGTNDFSSFISDASSKGAEVVMGQMTPPDGIALWKQMKSLGFKPPVAFVAKAASTTAWSKALGPVAEGTLQQSFWSSKAGLPGTDHLLQTIGATIPEPDSGLAVDAYAAGQVLMNALTTAGSTDPDKLNKALAVTTFDTAVGKIKFDDKHVWPMPEFISQWQGGKTVQMVPDAGNHLQAPAAGLQ